MILESAQILSGALSLHGCADTRLYKLTHKNHPSSVWARQSVRHYAYLLELFAWLSYEYSKRYHKTHKCDAMLDMFTDNMKLIPDNGFVDPPQCMPDEFKTEDTVKAYRNYYIGAKSDISVWKYSEEPIWYTVGLYKKGRDNV